LNNTIERSGKEHVDMQCHYLGPYVKFLVKLTTGNQNQNSLANFNAGLLPCVWYKVCMMLLVHEGNMELIYGI